MGLGQGRGGHRRLEAGIEAVEGPAQGQLHLAAGLVGGKGLQPILQAREVQGEGLAEDVGPRGEKLTQFDGDGAELLQ